MLKKQFGNPGGSEPRERSTIAKMQEASQIKSDAETRGGAGRAGAVNFEDAAGSGGRESRAADADPT